MFTLYIAPTQWCRLVAIILFALCFVGVSGAAVIKFGEIKPPIASTVPTGQGFLGNDFEVTPPPPRDMPPAMMGNLDYHRRAAFKCKGTDNYRPPLRKWLLLCEQTIFKCGQDGR